MRVRGREAGGLLLEHRQQRILAVVWQVLTVTNVWRAAGGIL